MKKASDLFIECLENEGVDTIFGLPGEENLDLINSIKDSSITFVTTRHEQAAAFMAATYGRLTGRPGVCLSTLGPGATNLTTGIAYALLGGMPLIAITGQKPIAKNSQAMFQILDIPRVMEPITKYSKSITNANNIPSVISNAFAVANNEKPGPVHIELPEDIAQVDLEAYPYKINNIDTLQASTDSIKKAVDKINQSTHPLILLGSGANRKNVYQSIRELIENHHIYYFTTQMGKGVMDESSPLYLGTAALSDNDFLHQAIDKSDLIINIGYDSTEKPPFKMKSQSEVIHIDYSNAAINDVYFPKVQVVGCISNTVTKINKLLDKKDRNTQTYQDIGSEFRKKVFEFDYKSLSPKSLERIVKEVRHTMPRDGILSLDNGLYKIWFARNYPAMIPNTVLLDNSLASMGAGLPVAIAAKILNYENKVLAICGDGGFLMNSQELETAKRLNLDLVILILKDDSYGMIKWKQHKMKMENYALDYGNPDFVKYAEAYGLNGHEVNENNSLESILQKTLHEKGIHLISCPIDYNSSDITLTHDLKNIIIES